MKQRREGEPIRCDWTSAKWRFHPSPNLSRRDLRRWRAILHNCEKHGWESQSKGRPGFLAYLKGMVAYVQMVNPEQGARLAEQLARVTGTAAT
ncbi:MAG: hypothetical protein NZT92_09085 [Abditibacteriales bacterium]|nr:hypothetical protein [Abditibacteriales bacterium]MDW8366143.1 hypothetical protein [Abditibacteriales bacterium]